MKNLTSQPSHRKKREELFQRVTRSFLRSVTKDPLESITFLDLSNCGLKRVTGLTACPNVEVVIVTNNQIDTLIDLSGCRHLWKLDISCNELRDLCGFEKFTTFGTLIASCNQLNWAELAKISHLEVLSLYLGGNQDLDKNFHYRKHVVKCLQKVWSLDGELITSEERSRIDYFFQQTAKSKKPVWLKLSSHHFVPSFRRKGSDMTVYGRRTADLCKCFGKNETHSKSLDSRRLQYLVSDFHTNLVLESCNNPSSELLKQCLTMRENSIEKWNMFVLLVISSLAFSIPSILMISSLRVIGMKDDELATCNAALDLPCQLRTTLTTFLFSFLKLHGLQRGITPRLYETMESMNNSLIKVAHGNSDVEIEGKHQHVLAAEIVQIFCLVPDFSSYMDDSSVLSILASATQNNEIEQEVGRLSCDCGTYKAKQNLVEFITLQIGKAKEKFSYMFNDDFKETDSFSKTDSEESISDSQIGKKACARSRPSTAPPFSNNRKLSPSVGDEVLLGPQRLGHIVSSPDVRVVLVQVDTLSSPRYLQADYVKTVENKQTLFYVNKDDLTWNRKFRSWVYQSSNISKKISTDLKSADGSEKRHGNVSLTLHKEPHQVGKRCKSTAQTDQRLSKSSRSSRTLSSKSKLDVDSIQVGQTSLQNRVGIDRQNDQDVIEALNNQNKASLHELKLDSMDSDYQPVFQANAFHLYYIDKSRYNSPILSVRPEPQTMHSRRSNSSCLRKSNWLASEI